MDRGKEQTQAKRKSAIMSFIPVVQKVDVLKGKEGTLEVGT